MDLFAETARLAQLMEERLDVSGADFATKVHRAGRMLPRYVRRAAEQLIVALPLLGHPHLMRQVNEEELSQAVQTIDAYLCSVDPWDRRIGIFVNWAAGLAFSLLILTGLGLWALYLLGVW